MVRLLMRFFVSPAIIALLDLVILIPIVLSIVSVLGTIWHGHLEEPMDVLEGVGVILIGWGVAIEERPSLRSMFGLTEIGDANFEAGIDLLCHSSGIGLLIFGLFSEIAVAAVRLPNHIVPTEGIDKWVLCVSTLFVGLGSYILTQHIGRLLIAMILGRVPTPHDAAEHQSTKFCHDGRLLPRGVFATLICELVCRLPTQAQAAQRSRQAHLGRPELSGVSLVPERSRRLHGA